MPAEALLNGVVETNLSEHHDHAQIPQRVVLKFGGTSIGKFAAQIGNICLYKQVPGLEF